jgi:hypothetical protein
VVRRILPKPREEVREFQSENLRGDDEAVQGKGQYDKTELKQFKQSKQYLLK